MKEDFSNILTPTADYWAKINDSQRLLSRSLQGALRFVIALWFAAFCKTLRSAFTSLTGFPSAIKLLTARGKRTSPKHRAPDGQAKMGES